MLTAMIRAEAQSIIAYQQKEGTRGGCDQASETEWSPSPLQPESWAKADHLGCPPRSVSGGVGAAAAWCPAQAACGAEIGSLQNTHKHTQPLAMNGR